jgi:hypothetical protein
MGCFGHVHAHKNSPRWRVCAWIFRQWIDYTMECRQLCRCR